MQRIGLGQMANDSEDTLFTYAFPWNNLIADPQCDEALLGKYVDFAAWKTFTRSMSMHLFILSWPEDVRAYKEHANQFFGFVAFGIDANCDFPKLRFKDL
jgi:hypothetical protein